ncbi:NAD-dependent epimerase/dehydratase family protein [Candidatus Bathyarchaeota archaeon]|nr:NAD-dependent epimerase/dehydratase family protein [Candidatus Bathyarchaeota archaeon]
MGGDNRRVMVTGALGQIGSELVPHLQLLYGTQNVLATDIKEPSGSYSSSYERLDVLNVAELRGLVKGYDIDVVYHLAAILSATGEMRPDLAWDVNINGFRNVLEMARESLIDKIFHPSSIAAFGTETPRLNTPQDTVLTPRTIYGVTKVTGELLGKYFFEKFGVDVRGIRLPGVISNVAPPGGGTTDYAVEIFYEAIERGSYECFLRPDTTLPMIYMPDCLKAFQDLMDAPSETLKHRTSYNLSSLSFNPAELAAEIMKHKPEFTITYKPDFRQEIADSWPMSIDDSCARAEWGWSPDYDLGAMVDDMCFVLAARHESGKI